MRRLIFAISLAVFAAQPLSVAADEGEPPRADMTRTHSFSANVLLATEYMFRGLTQSNEGLAIQGGFDYEYTPMGFYIGFWASSIEFPGLSQTNPSSVETNLYGGFTGEFSNGIGWDIGGLYYYYPDQSEDCCGAGDYNYVEMYGNLSYTFSDLVMTPEVTVGFDWSPDYFGEDNDGIHLEGAFDFSLPEDFALNFVVGYLDVEGDKTFTNGYDYVYYSIGVSKSFGILDFALSWNDAGSDCDDVLAGGNDDLCEAVIFTVGSSWGG